VPVEVAALGLIEVITAMCSVIAALEAKLATVFDQHTQATVTGFPELGGPWWARARQDRR
jgi:hypothetical protein